MSAGRPIEYDINDIIEKLNTYIDKHREPFIQEFILKYGISKSHFYELARNNEELSHTIKRGLLKQELYLVKETEKGNINATFAIFRLKQKDFGYTDKIEQDVVSHNTNENLNYNIDDAEQRQNRINELLQKMQK